MRGKKIKILCVAFGILLFAAVCVYGLQGKKEGSVQKKGQEDRSVSYASVGQVSYSKIGAFYADDQDQLLYLDAGSGKETVACGKAGCEHQSHAENKDTECAADIYGFSYDIATTVIQQGQYVYLLQHSEEELSDYALYRQNLDGSQRKKIMVLKDSKVLRPYQMVCDGKWLVITCDQSFREDEKTGNLVDLKERDIVLAVVNLEETTCSFYSVAEQCPKDSTEPYVSSMSIDTMSINGDILYFLCSYVDGEYQMEEAAQMDDAAAWKYEAEHRHQGIWQFLLGKGTIMEPAPALASYNIDDACINGAEVLFQSKTAEMVGYVDLSKEQEDLSDVEGLLQVRDIQPSEDDIRIVGIAGEDLYYYNYDNDRDRCTYYVYHRKTGTEEILPEPPEGYLFNYLSDQYAFFSIFDENGVMDNLSGNIACVSLKDVGEGNYAAKSGQQKAAENEAAPEDDSLVWGMTSADSLVWGVTGTDLPDSEAVAEINRKLKERGFSRQVKFIYVDVTNREQFSADFLKEQYPEVDIMQVPGNMYNENRPGNLIHESYYENLQPYLQGEGKELYQSVHENAWKQVTVGDAIYTVPSTWLGYQGLYAIWNRKYIPNADQMGEDFSLAELEKNLAAADVEAVENPVVFVGDSLTVCEDSGWLEGETNLGLYYGKDQQVLLWYQAEEVKELFRTFHRWYEKGWLSEKMEMPVWGEYIAETDGILAAGEYVLALGNGSIPEKVNQDEVVIQRIGREKISHKLGLSAGVVASSDCKEEAEAFLQLAYTDREIADLMFYGVEGTYQKEKGVVTEKSEEFLEKVQDMRLSFGNQNAATPMEDDPSMDPDAAQAEYYADKKRFYDSATLGFVANTRGYEETIQELVEEEQQYLNIWKSKDFEKEYQKVCDKLKQKKYQEYAKEIQRQIQEWKAEGKQ